MKTQRSMNWPIHIMLCEWEWHGNGVMRQKLEAKRDFTDWYNL
jgi:hypothetical protein